MFEREIRCKYFDSILVGDDLNEFVVKEGTYTKYGLKNIPTIVPFTIELQVTSVTQSLNLLLLTTVEPITSSY